jgi:hypothetical protein
MVEYTPEDLEFDLRRVIAEVFGVEESVVKHEGTKMQASRLYVKFSRSKGLFDTDLRKKLSAETFSASKEWDGLKTSGAGLRVTELEIIIAVHTETDFNLSLSF